MTELEQHEISDIIQMALSDHVSFADIEGQYGLKESQVKTLMRQNLKRGSYQAWRKRVARFASRRAHYKRIVRARQRAYCSILLSDFEMNIVRGYPL